MLLANESTPGLPLQGITYKLQQCGALAVVYRDKVSGADLSVSFFARVRLCADASCYAAALTRLRWFTWCYLFRSVAPSEYLDGRRLKNRRALARDADC